MRWLSTLAVAVLLSIAGCGAFAGADAGRATVTPAPVPTATETAPPSPPPGVTTARLDNVVLLSAAHRQALNGTTYTLQERYYEMSTERNSSRSVRRSETVAVESPTRYRDEMVRATTDANGTISRYEQSTYADGTSWYERRDNGTIERQNGQVRFTRDKYAYRTAFYLNRYAVVNQSSTTVLTTTDGRLYRIRGTGGEIPSTARLAAFRIELLVESDGLVRRFNVRYRTEDRTVTYSFWYEDVGETTAEQPAWLSEATTAN